MFESLLSNEMPIDNGKPSLQDGPEGSAGKSPFLCPVANRAKSVPLNEILEKIPLAYSPLTKQLHLIYPKQEGAASTIDACSASPEAFCMSIGDYECQKRTDFTQPSDICPLSSDLDLDKELEDEMSHVSIHEAVGPSEIDESSLSSETSHQLEESLVDDSTRRKKKGISGFFSRYLSSSFPYI